MFTRAKGSLLAGLLVGALVGTGSTVVSPEPAEAAPSSRLTRWGSDADFNTGYRSHVWASGGAVRLAGALPVTTWDDPHAPGGAVAYEYGQWTSPWVTPGFGATSLVPSWTGATPRGTWVRIDVRVKRGPMIGTFDTLANWATDTSTIRRSSSTSQADDLATVDVDTLRSRGAAFDAWQVQVTLLRRKGSTATPAISSIGGVAATYSTTTLPATSRTTMTATKVLAVPSYSQRIHRNEFTAYGGGGAAWCSPTTAAMLLRYWGTGPTPAQYAFARRYKDPWVDHAAVNAYDHQYGSTGNWSFTTAYAGQWADAYVTRVGSLRDAEAFIRTNIPVGAAIKYGSGQLSGAPLRSTGGHVVAVVGFASSGDVVVNDPAGSTNAKVRRTYKRAQFERAWLGGSGGIAYVVRR